MTNLDFSANQSGRSTRGRTPVWRVQLDGADWEDIEVSGAEFYLSAGQHDMVLLTMASSEMTDTEGLVDKPIFFVFGQSPRIEPFYGYIHTATEGNSTSGALQFNLVVMGSTRVLQGGEPRFWRDRTIPGAVQQVVQKTMLGYTGHTHPHKWKALAQTGESDWEFAVSRANRLGWKVYSRSGVVMCYDPEVLFQEVGPYVSLISTDEELFNTQAERQILSFDAQEESVDTPQLLGTKVGYFDGVKPSIVTQEGDYNRYRFRHDVILRDRNEAEVFRTAFEQTEAFDNQRASVRLYGEADLYPGMAADITTSNYRLYRGKFDGRWMIQAVTHKMDKTSFQTSISLLRPGKARIQDIPYRSFWDMAGRGKPSMFLEDDGERKTWVSSWADARARSVA